MKCSVLSIIMALSVLVFSYGCGNSKPDQTANSQVQSDNQEQKYRVIEYKDGWPIADVEVPQTDSLRLQLVEYLRVIEGYTSKSTRVSYAPSLLILSETLKINILHEKIVVSTRKNGTANWNTTIRDKVNADLEFEVLLLKFTEKHHVAIDSDG